MTWDEYYKEQVKEQERERERKLADARMGKERAESTSMGEAVGRATRERGGKISFPGKRF
jgi:hypothetical protein